MRERLNSDPKAQMALIAVLLIAGIFFFISKSGGGEESEEAAPAPEAAVSSTTAGISSTPATGAAFGPGEEAAKKSTPETASPEGELSSLDTPKLPKAVTQAYKANKTVVLLVVHDGGIDDVFTALATKTLEGNPEVALFATKASGIYRYAAITLGVEVSRVPALIVMRPRNLSKGEPQATVTYGAQTVQDVQQAVRDASYDGPGATYHPG